MNSFGGYEEIVDILGGSLHYWTNWGGGSFLYILGLFLKARYRMGIFFGATKFQKFIWECLTFLIFLLGIKAVDAGSKPTYAEKWRVG